MKSLNETNEAWPGVRGIIINISLKQWIENEEKSLPPAEKPVYVRSTPCVGRA